ncbi:helix-turn-helix domain-containing protein, partial [Streptomyces diastatochromogenes]
MVTVTQLSTFVLVARLGSVGAAARTLDVSESAVSQA